MKKSIKRVICGALALLMSSSLIAERVISLSADTSLGKNGLTTTSNVQFKNVTGQFDTSKIVESNLNSSVLKNEDVAPKYETRTVMVTLKGDSMMDAAGKQDVNEFSASFSGERRADEIESEQEAFLKALKKKGIPYTFERAYDTVLNAVAIEIDTKYVSEIKKMKDVDSVVITTAFAEPETIETTKDGKKVVTNETDVYATGIYDSSTFVEDYGAGAVVAILDTGLDYTHPAFQGFQTEGVDVAWSKDDVKAKIATQDLTSESRSGSLEVSDVYVSAKVPFAYDYADDDADVYPSYSNHGTHVAGIIGGYDESGYTDKDGVHINETFKGVVPDAQLVICKVFTDDLNDKDLGGAVSPDIVAALEDCVKLGVDVINMSLGTSCGFTTTDDGDSEGDMLNKVYESITDAGISLVCAASNDYSSGYGGVYGTNLAVNPDSSTVGSPSTYASALSVASINGQKASYAIANEGTDFESYVFYEESRDIDGNPFDFVKGLTAGGKTEFEYVLVPGVGHAADYTSTIKGLLKDKNGVSTGRIAVIKRGDTSFQEKVEIAMEMGAVGVIIYNNVAGIIRMNLGEIENPIPAVSVSMNAGNALVSGAKRYVGKIKLDAEYQAGPFMSEFSSWGPTHDLKIKPEITAHGGEITSTVPGGYGEQSGTSMASPNMAGFMAVVRSYIKKDMANEVERIMQAYDCSEAVAINRIAMQLTMSTAGTVYDQDNLPYSPRKQGAGVAKLENVVGGTSAYLWTDVAENDYRPKIEVGDDHERTGEYVLTFNVTNFGADALAFSVSHVAMTETLSSDKLTVSEQAHMLNDATAVWTMNGNAVEDGKVSISAGTTAQFSVTLTLSDAEKAYIDASFANGMYVEGFLKLSSSTDGQCDLAVPFLGFYGDWEASEMLDYSAYEVADCEKDASILDEDKIKASVFATMPYSSYYNEKYVIPMGGYVYLLPDDADPMYAEEKHASISRYNTYYGEGNVENYMTSTQIKAVYAGLLRNARVVKYKLYDVETGEVVLTDSINRVSKAFSGGGQATPANVKLELGAEANGLVANGTYKMEFEFYMNDPDKIDPATGELMYGVFQDDPTTEEIEDVTNALDTFEFSFTVDYEAPILEDARVRYYTYKDGNVEKQRIYLDVDVYDNHYAQSMMLCYPKVKSNGDVVLQLATEYLTPVRNAVKNGATTVSIEITDIYEQYGNQLYVQFDDYALNSCLYLLNINNANADVLPDGKDFGLGVGEESLKLERYETHKVSLVYGDAYTGNADKSNFQWTSANPSIAAVKNGEIVGISEGSTRIFVSNRKGTTYTINVTVSDKVSASLASVPSISFGVIKTNEDALVKAAGQVPVSAGKEFKMEIISDPWYHPMTDLRIVWSSSNEAVATVDANGNVKTLKKGTAIISAKLEQKKVVNGEDVWESTLYSTNVILKVQNEFTVSSYTLMRYNGVGYNAWVCPDCGEAYTQSELVNVEGTQNCCPDCKKVCTQSTDILKIPTDMNIMFIGENAFEDNNNIKKIIIPSSVMDIRAYAFMNCTALEEVYFVSMNKQEIADADVAMIYEYAFYGCKNLRKVDFSNTKTVTVAGDCFGACPKLSEVVDMPSIGMMHDRAFAGTALTSADLTGLHMSGTHVFAGCTKLQTVTTGQFTSIGAYMFYGCTALRNEITVYSSRIGDYAFAGCTNLAGVTLKSPEGQAFEFEIGAHAFENCGTNLRGNFNFNFGTESIRVIGDRAFAGSSLKTIASINGLEVLGADAFTGTEISSLTVGDSFDFATIRLGGVPFDGITLKVASGSEKYKEQDGVIYNADKTQILFVNASVTGTFVVPAGVTKLGDYAFAVSKIDKIVLADSVTELGVGVFESSTLTAVDFAGATLTAIPENAFRNSFITAIVLPESVTKLGANAFASSALATFKGDGLEEIGSRAFENCLALREIALADGIETMGDGVFYGCKSLEEATMPSVKKLGEDTFYGASALKKVTFGDNATTIGDYTFVRTPIKTVVLGNALEKVGQGAFYGCNDLKAIVLPDTVTEIAQRAFEGCRNLSEINLENVNVIGDYAFYNTSLKALNLESATTIGYMAFATQNRTGTYTKVSLPNVVSIANYAFYNGAQASVELPASVETIGKGVFASSKNLTAVTVAENNENFFAKDGVLYRYVDKDAGEYELLCYPAGKMATEGEYAVLEGTLRVQAYAFYGLKDGAIRHVVLPYSVNTIGDSAFFASGIKEYSFESIQAPTLEVEYRSEVAQQIEAVSSISYYKGYYYTNFETYVLDFTTYGKKTSTLKMNYPVNGAGYDNHVYKLFFGERTPSEEALIEDYTREFVSLVTNMPSAEEIKAWLKVEKTDENVAMVKAFAETVKTARSHYNNATADEGQAKFVTEELSEKLLAVEEALRSVKKYMGIPFVVSGLQVSEASAHKSEYKVGEKFKMDGLVILVVYDDYSVEEADFDELELLTSGKLTTYNKYVEIACRGAKVRVVVSVVDDSVVEEPEEEPVAPETPVEKPDYGKTALVIAIAFGGVFVLVLIGAGFGRIIDRKREEREAKEQARQDYKDEYGEIHVNVETTIPAGAHDSKESEQAYINLVMERYAKSPVQPPEGEQIKSNVEINRK